MNDKMLQAVNNVLTLLGPDRPSIVVTDDSDPTGASGTGAWPTCARRTRSWPSPARCSAASRCRTSTTSRASSLSDRLSRGR